MWIFQFSIFQNNRQIAKYENSKITGILPMYNKTQKTKEISLDMKNSKFPGIQPEYESFQNSRNSPYILEKGD